MIPRVEQQRYDVDKENDTNSPELIIVNSTENKWNL